MVQGEQLLGQVEMSELRVAEDDMVQAKVGFTVTVVKHGTHLKICLMLYPEKLLLRQAGLV